MEALKGLNVKSPSSAPRFLICKTRRVGGISSLKAGISGEIPPKSTSRCVQEEAGRETSWAVRHPPPLHPGEAKPPQHWVGGHRGLPGGGAGGRRGPTCPLEPRAVVSVPGRSREPSQLTSHGRARLRRPAAPARLCPERRTLQWGKSVPARPSSAPGPAILPPLPQLRSLAHPYPPGLAPRKPSREGPWPGSAPRCPQAARRRWPRGAGGGKSLLPTGPKAGPRPQAPTWRSCSRAWRGT